jgi:hypothetical protein
MANGFSVPDGTTLAAMEKAGAPKAQVSALQSWWQRQLVQGQGGEQSKLAVAKLHVAAAGEAVRAGGEGVITGGVLGAIHAKLPGGLDMKIGTTPAGQPAGTNIHQVPIDAAIGVAALAGAVFGATTPGGKDLQNVGTAALAVFSFRKMNDLTIQSQFKAAGATPGGGAKPASVVGTFIGHPVIAGESRFGWAPGSARPRGAADWGEDPIAAAARGV